MDNLLTYTTASGGPLVQGDGNNTPNAYVKRGADKSVNVGQVNGTTINVSATVLLANTVVTATGTFSGATSVLRVTAAAGNVTVTLPPAASVSGMLLHVKRTDSSGNTCTIQGNGGTETIDGATTITLGAIGKATLYSNGTGWDVLA